MRVRLKIKVVPGAARDGIAGWLGERLKLRVTAAPEKGRANAAVSALLADRLRVSTRDIRIVSGSGSARKTVEVDGLTMQTLRRRLA